MDHTTEVIIKSLLLPPGGLILLLFFSLLFIRKLFGKLLLTITMVAFYLLSTTIISTNLIAGLEQHVFVTPEEILASKAEVIVVLGGGLYEEGPEYGGDSIRGDMLERVRYAAWLHKRTNLPIIVSGGGMDPTIPAEAKLAGQALKEEFGCTVLATEDQSKTTWENALYTKNILTANGISKIALVTHAWHMPRAMGVFKQNDIDAIAAPTIFSTGKLRLGDGEIKDWLPSSAALSTSYLALHEYAGLAWYQTKGQIEL
jgi:uncharacterized SAM-binding protein YcdF (DUF218 family)